MTKEVACPHCGKMINPGAMLGSIMSERKREAARQRGEKMRKMWANQKMMDGAKRVEVDFVHNRYEMSEAPKAHGRLVEGGAPVPASKREVFEALKAKLGGVPKVDVVSEHKMIDNLKNMVPLSETPCAPFDLVVEGEEHRVAQVGKKLMLMFIGPDGAVPVRELRDGELEKLWEKRKK